MPDILHRFTIDTPREKVHDLIATKEGVERSGPATRTSKTTQRSGST